MINVLVYGALGRMGSIVVNRVEQAGDMAVAAGVDVYSGGGAVYSRLEEVKEKADVVIDFSHHTLTPALLDWCVQKNVPLVLCTTGHDEAEKAAIHAAAEKIPVFFSANMSIGIALLAELARRAAALFPEADIEIVEAHHNRKLDAPSGTALAMADGARQAGEKRDRHPGRPHGQPAGDPRGVYLHRQPDHRAEARGPRPLPLCRRGPLRRPVPGGQARRPLRYEGHRGPGVTDTLGICALYHKHKQMSSIIFKYLKIFFDAASKRPKSPAGTRSGGAFSLSKNLPFSPQTW